METQFHIAIPHYPEELPFNFRDLHSVSNFVSPLTNTFSKEGSLSLHLLLGTGVAGVSLQLILGPEQRAHHRNEIFSGLPILRFGQVIFFGQCSSVGGVLYLHT